MFEFENWKNEIVDEIKQLHEETKLIREYLEEDEETDLDKREVQEEEEKDDLDNEEDDEELQVINTDEEEVVILQKLDEINDSINTLNKSVVEGSIVIAITIVVALAFHYLVNQLSKW